MKNRNRLIALIDFSEYSDRVIKFASEFSQLIDAEVLFVHQVSGLVPAYADLENRHQILGMEIEEAKNKLIAITLLPFPTPPKFIVNDKHLVNTLQELSSEGYDDWILLGLKGTGFIKELFIGNTAIRIIDGTKLLTLAIPLEESVSVPTELIVAVSPKYPLNKFQLDRVLENLKSSVKHITFVSVYQGESDISVRKELLKDLCRAYSEYGTDQLILEEGEPITRLLEMVESKGNPFLVVQQGSRSLVDTIFRKYLVNELVNYGATPLIILSQH